MAFMVTLLARGTYFSSANSLGWQLLKLLMKGFLSELANEDVSLSERSCLQLPYPGSSSLDSFLFRQQIFTLSHSSLVRTGLISPPATHLLTKIDFESFAFSSYA